MNALPRAWPSGRFAVAVAAAVASIALPAQSPVRLTSNSGPGSRHPVVALDAPVVAYVAVVAGSRELFTVPAGGGTPVQRTSGADVRVGHGVLDVWPPISLSDDGQVVAYWNAGGVHVQDRAGGNDVVVATTALLPFPQLDGDGSRVVFQAPVNGALEVFVAACDGSTGPVQLTQNSGAGRRLPHVRAGKVVFQKPVGAHMELFVHDLDLGTTTGPLTSSSGGGNRHGRLTPDGSAVVYEAVVGDWLTPMRRDLAGGTPVVLATGTSGARLPVGDGDAQVVLQSTAAAPEVWLADPALSPLTTTSRGGHRQPSLDRHGQLVVWQQEHLGRNEVWAHRRCWPVFTGTYGQAGPPSVGTLTPFFRTWRCQQSVGVRSQLAPGTVALMVLGSPQQVDLGPLGAPGNWSLVTIASWQALLASAAGDFTFTFPMAPALLQARVCGQFVVSDPAANALGLVTSAGFATTFP